MDKHALWLTGLLAVGLIAALQSTAAALLMTSGSIITRDLYEKDDFIIRKLDISKFNKKKIYGPKQNPFCPWFLRDH